MSSSESQHPHGGDFSERLVDGFFRRWFLYMVPIALFAAAGVYSAGNLTGDFASYTRLSASSNPYVTQADIRGTDIGLYETPAAGTARLVNEQLRTDAFIDQIAERAGLTQALDSRLVTRDQIRSQIGASANGENNLNISASWDDPDTALALVQSTTAGYRDYLADLAVADSAEAIEFLNGQLQNAEADRLLAEEELSSYVAQLPTPEPGEERPVEQVLAIQRLSSSIDRALDAEREAETAIDAAEFAAAQAVSESSRQFLVIDAPEAATTPTSVRRDQVVTIAMFTLLGLVVAAASLILSTAADRSIRTRSQLVNASGVPAVVVIPRIKQLRRRKPKAPEPSDQAA